MECLEADNLIIEGNRIAKSKKAIFLAMIGKKDTLHRACDLYNDAGNLFKEANNFYAAGNTFLKVAKVCNRLNRKYCEVNNIIKAGNCFKLCDSDKAIDCFLNGIKIYVEMDRFSMAAKLYIYLAEIYEKEKVNIKKSIEYYNKAIDYYQTTSQSSSLIRCYKKITNCYIEIKDYEKAINIYDELVELCMNNTLSKEEPSDYVFRSVLCHFCLQDVSGGLEKYFFYQQYISFLKEKDEFKLIEDLSSSSPEDCIDILSHFKAIDDFVAILLNQIRQNIEKALKYNGYDYCL